MNNVKHIIVETSCETVGADKQGFNGMWFVMRRYTMSLVSRCRGMVMEHNLEKR